MEAMACGCVTIGYDGGGGAEYLKQPYATPIPSQDIPAYATAVERAIREIESNPRLVWERTRESSRFIHANYSPEIEANDITTTWKRILAAI